MVYHRREYHVEYRVNSRGLRGPERAYEKTPGTAARAGAGRLLRRGLHGRRRAHGHEPAGIPSGRRAGARAEVINGGTVGYSTDQEYLFYRDEGRKYAPDVVVLFVYHNDIPTLVLERYQAYPKPRLDFTTDPPAVSNQPVPPYVPAPAAPVPPSPTDGPTSYLFELVKQRLERTSARTYNRLAGFGLWEPLRKLPMNEELQLYHVPELGHQRPAWSAFTWTVQSLSKATTSAGVRLVVAYVPSRMEVSPRVWELTQERYGIDERSRGRRWPRRVQYITGRLWRADAGSDRTPRPRGLAARAHLLPDRQPLEPARPGRGRAGAGRVPRHARPRSRLPLTRCALHEARSRDGVWV